MIKEAIEKVEDLTKIGRFRQIEFRVLQHALFASRALR